MNRHVLNHLDLLGTATNLILEQRVLVPQEVLHSLHSQAGLGLNAALLRVARDLDYAHPELSAELAVVNAEIRAGIDRSRALRDLVERTGLEDLKALVLVLVQSLRFGTSISMSLRVYSEEFRDKRLQAAEEHAAKLSTKMIFPLIFCFLPGFFIVAVGPAFLRFVALFAP